MTGTAVIGLGNLIKGDDGVGIQILDKIKEEIPKEIDLIDGGTAGLNILNFMEQYSKIIVVDAINLGHNKGKIIELEPDDVIGNKKINLSAHDIDFVDSLQIGKELGIEPEIKIIGIEIGEIRSKKLTTQLSQEIKNSLPKLKKKILKELKQTSKNKTQKQK